MLPFARLTFLLGTVRRKSEECEGCSLVALSPHIEACVQLLGKPFYNHFDISHVSDYN
jgi:hypothetical protein